MTSTSERLKAAIGDRYRIERELGAGGMATVYLAHDLKHERMVAIKVLHEDLGATLGPERFLAEIKTTAKLQHPHVLPLLDSGSTATAGESGGLLYYVMPFVAGESLRDRLDRDKQLPIEDAVRIAREIADALGLAHANGIVHRDIKPENILLQGGHALVADFGIALAVQHAGGVRMTQTGLSLGTPQYMSPEQAMGEKVVDARADIYALGAVTYEMLVGDPPFTGATVQAIVAKVLSSEPEPPTTMRKTIPAHVEQAVLIALAKLPADRFGSAAEFATALIGGTARTIATARRPRAGPRRAQLQWAAVLALLVGAWVAGRLSGSARSAAAPAPPVRFTLPLELSRNTQGRMIAVAPDGSRFVFRQQLGRGGESQLAMVRLDRAGVELLPDTESATGPFFSPDGEWLAFQQGGRLKKTRLDGSPAVTIAEASVMSMNIQFGGAWGRDGSMLFATRAGGLFRVPDAGGGKPQKIALPEGFWYSAPIWLHDDNHIVLLRESPGGGGLADREMVVYSLDDARLVGTLGKGLPIEYVDGGYLAFVSPDGALSVAPLDPRAGRFTGEAQIIAAGVSYLARSLPVAVARSGAVLYASDAWTAREMIIVSDAGRTTVLPLGQHAFRGPRFSPDGRRIAVGDEPGGDLLGDVYMFDRGTETFTRITREGTSVFPEWTVDGNALLYSALNAGGNRSMFRIPVDRSASPVLVVEPPAASAAFEAFMTRGDTVVFRTNLASTGRDIYMRLPDGKSVPWEAGPFDERSPTLSPDGRLVLYVSNESGRDQVYVRRLAVPGSVQVSVFEGAEPVWGPGGRDAFYWGRDTLFAVPIGGSPAPSLGTRRVVLTGSYEREAYHANYDVAPDGRSFVMIRRSNGANAAVLQVLLNWIPVPKAAGTR